MATNFTARMLRDKAIENKLFAWFVILNFRSITFVMKATFVATFNYIGLERDKDKKMRMKNHEENVFGSTEIPV